MIVLSFSVSVKQKLFICNRNFLFNLSHNLCATLFYRSHSRQYEVNSLLNMHVSSPTPTPTDVLIPDLYLTDQAALSETSIIECEIASQNTRKYNFFYSCKFRRVCKKTSKVWLSLSIFLLYLFKMWSY